MAESLKFRLTSPQSKRNRQRFPGVSMAPGLGSTPRPVSGEKKWTEVFQSERV